GLGGSLRLGVDVELGEASATGERVLAEALEDLPRMAELRRAALEIGARARVLLEQADRERARPGLDQLVGVLAAGAHEQELGHGLGEVGAVALPVARRRQL